MPSKTIPKSQSLFSLSKVVPTDQTVSTVHTVNFLSKGNIDSPELQNYFDSRFKFLTECYNFARDKKISENYDFDQSAATQEALRAYLGMDQLGNKLEAPKATMITGAEFEIISTKVGESIASINKNEYLKNLERDIKLKYINEVEGTDTQKLKPSEIEKLVKRTVISLETLFNLSSVDIQSIFKYELFQICGTWLNILSKCREDGSNCNEYNVELTTEILDLINKFLTDSFGEFEKIYTDVRISLFNKSDKIKDPVKAFVNRFFFVFDGRIKLLEAEYCLEINEKLNEWVQGLSPFFVQGFENDSDKITKVREVIYKVQKLDFSSHKTSEEFVKILNTIASPDFGSKVNEDIEEDYKQQKKEYNNLFLRHPKSAPSYPNISDRILKWNSQNCTSKVFDANKHSFDSKRFLDYLLFRAKKVIENDEFYCIYRFLTKNEDSLDWAIFLDNILTNKVTNICLDNNYLAELKSVERKQLETRILMIDPKKNKEIKQYRFLTNAGNDKFALIQFLNNSENSIEAHLTKKLSELTSKYSELYVLKELNAQNVLDKLWIKNWIETLRNSNKTKDEQQNEINKELIKKKLNVNTENRLNHFATAPQNKNNLIYEYLTEYLITLENHLLLSEDQPMYKVFDKLAFKRYQNISQLIFESTLSDKDNKNSFKAIRIKKAELAKLLLDRDIIIPLKISRMTNRTNGNSTLLFDTEFTESGALKATNNGYLICSPTKMLTGDIVKIVDNYASATKELSKKDTKFSHLMVGFLNGSGDNRSNRKINLVYDKEGNQLFRDAEKTEFKSYQTYSDWQILGNLDGLEISQTDKNRGDNESVGGTSPAGYPKLYYYLIPKVCSSLLIPVETSNYYLKKYSPNQYISKYLELEKSIDKSLGQDKVDKFKQLLELRCNIRFYYAISSFELDLKKELRLQNHKIVPKITAIGHLQFSNPTKQPQEFDTEKDKVVEKKDYLASEIQTKFESILSIDLGEKHLAVASLQSIDWDKKSLCKNSVQFYLPLQYKLEKNIKLNSELVSNFDRMLGYDFQNNTVFEANEDRTYLVFDSIKKQYKQQQKELGTVNSSLRQKKNNFTDQIIETISTQIAKLALQHKSFVVFERLQTGLSSRKLEVTTCTEILNQTYKKLSKVGLTLGTDPEYLSKGIGKGIARINPFMTSQTCSECNYVPIFYKRSDKKTDDENQLLKNNSRINIIDDQWLDRGLIEFKFGNKLFASIQDQNGALECKSIRSKTFSVDDFLGHYKYYKKINSSYKPIIMIDWLQENLFTTVNKQRVKVSETVKSVFKSTIIKPRLNQDLYLCPCCGMTMNADYNAAKNIAKKFIDGLE